MRYIPTSSAIVDGLKKQAKKLQRKGGGKYADLLNLVAKRSGYLHWHHVSICLKETEAKRGVDALHADCEIILRAAREGVEKVIATNVGELSRLFVMFGSQRQAWLLDPDGNRALCLMVDGQEQPRHFEDRPRRIVIDWDGGYKLDGDAFVVHTEHPLVGSRVFTGFPMKEIRQYIAKAESFEKRFATLFAQTDAVDLTPDIIARLVTQGWNEKELEQWQRDGARYSPSRNSLLSPQRFEGFDSDEGEPGGPEPSVSA